MRRALLLACVLAAACGSTDPCAGVSGTCVALTADGSLIIDQLLVLLSGATQGSRATTPSRLISLPQTVALQLGTVTDGQLEIQVVALAGGNVIGRGSGDATVALGQRAQTTVEIAAVGATLDGDGGDGDSEGESCANIPGLVAYFPLDSESTDHSGNGHDLQLTNTHYAGGKLGQALSFNGTTSSALVGGSALALTGRTFCAWIEVAPRMSAGEPLFTGGQGAIGETYGLQASIPSGTNCTAPASSLFVDPGSGCHAGSIVAPVAAFTYVCYAHAASGQVTLFVDSAVQNVSIPLTPFDLTSLTLGNNVLGFPSTAPAFTGTIDSVSIWNRALSSSEMDLLYANGAGCRVRP